MRAIFISYRREDSEGHAGRLFADLKARFGDGSVFMDVSGIEPGRDFRRVIEEQVASCGVLLAIIGKNWLEVVDGRGQRRLDDAADFVRLETASALRRDIPVIPVLVHDASMPRAEQLPDDLKDLAYRNSVELTHARWASDVQLLIAALQPYVDIAPAPAAAPPPSAAWPRWWWALPVVAVAAGGGALVLRQRAAPSGAAPPLAVAASAAAPGISVAVSGSAASEPPRMVVAAAPSVGAASAASPAPPRPVDKPTVSKKPAPASVPPAPAPQAVAVVAPAPVAAPPRVVDAPPPPAPAPSSAASSAPTATVLATASDPGLDWFGNAAPVTMATRTIAIKPDTSYVNVTGGEIIRFDVGERSFVWNFNGRPSSFDLRRVAPSALLDRKVTVYVAPNPMYPRRN